MSIIHLQQRRVHDILVANSKSAQSLLWMKLQPLALYGLLQQSCCPTTAWRSCIAWGGSLAEAGLELDQEAAWDNVS